MDGIINVYKPCGITSHDVISRVRKILNTRRVGHTGTLDPMACGVLPICVGKATRAAELIVASEKEYVCNIKFGSETITQDSTGEVVKVCDKRPDESGLLNVLPRFTGEISQIPPMYSAISIGGERLYKKARRGETVERQPRKINIYGIEILSFTPDEAVLRIICSKGTYIRTLCEDIGRGLGTLAHMSALERTRSGVFTVENAVKTEDICEDVIIPTDEIFADYEKIILTEKEETKVRNGAEIKKAAQCGKTYRLYGHGGDFLCISECAERDGERILHSIKNFY